MNNLKKSIARQFRTFYYFFTFVRYRVIAIVALSFIVALLDGFGLAMFMPLIQLVAGDGQMTSEGLGNLSFIVDVMSAMNLDLTLITVLLVMLMFFLMTGVVKFLSGYYRIGIKLGFVTKLRNGLLDSLNSFSYKKFVLSDIGRLQNSMTGEVEKVAQGFTFYFESIHNFILALFYLSFTLFIDFQFAVLVIFGAGSLNFIFVKLNKLTKIASRKLTGDSNLFQGEVIQYVSNYKYLRATATSDCYSKKLNNSILDIEVNRKKIGLYNEIMKASKEPMMILVIVLVILIQVHLLGGAITGLLLSLLFLFRALNALVQLQSTWNKYLAVVGSIENVQDFQKELISNKESASHSSPYTFNDSISLVQMDFSFDGLKKILDDVTITIHKNKTIAFVGESGSGKTTIVNIISGLLPVDKGQLLVDGVCLKDIDKRMFQKRIGYITQEAVIFSDTIYNNVTLWSDRTPENELRFWEALKKAAIYQFVDSLENRADMMLGSNGMNLSGGQKQKISIARELFKDIHVLILDEATSSLDSESEKLIQENIDSLHGHYTILVIAHRLATIKNADLVVYLKNGRIDGLGTFEELLDSNNEFKKMVELQNLI